MVSFVFHLLHNASFAFSPIHILEEVQMIREAFFNLKLSEFILQRIVGVKIWFLIQARARISCDLEVSCVMFSIVAISL